MDHVEHTWELTPLRWVSGAFIHQLSSSMPMLHWLKVTPRKPQLFSTSGLDCTCKWELSSFGKNFDSEELNLCVLEMRLSQLKWEVSITAAAEVRVGWGAGVYNSFEKGSCASSAVSKAGHTYVEQAFATKLMWLATDIL